MELTFRHIPIKKTNNRYSEKDNAIEYGGPYEDEEINEDSHNKKSKVIDLL